jgi:hypothetical protein
MSDLIYARNREARQRLTRRATVGYYRRLVAAAGSGANLLECESRVSPADAQQLAEFKQGARVLRRNGAGR